MVSCISNQDILVCIHGDLSVMKDACGLTTTTLERFFLINEASKKMAWCGASVWCTSYQMTLSISYELELLW